MIEDTLGPAPPYEPKSAFARLPFIRMHSFSSASSSRSDLSTASSNSSGVTAEMLDDEDCAWGSPPSRKSKAGRKTRK